MSIPLDLSNIADRQAALTAAQTGPSPLSGTVAQDDLPTVMTADEVADLLRVDRKTVYEAVKDGTLPALRLRKVIRFCREEVLQFLRGNTRPRSSRSSR
jgi:excisionase family DNA binding protein